jgi:hypothetical protein
VNLNEVELHRVRSELIEMNPDWQFTSPVRSMPKLEDVGFEKKASLVSSSEQSKAASLAAWDKTPTTKVLCVMRLRESALILCAAESHI